LTNPCLEAMKPAAPASVFSRGTEGHNQDKVPMGPIAARDLKLPLRAARDEHLRAFERAYLRQALAAAGNNVTAAARIAGIDRIYFYRLLWKYGLR
jgi:transcriptional regulator of acetoin/glycerol metabolism